MWRITSNAKNRGLAYGFFGVIGFKDDSTDKVISIKDLVFKDVNIDINDTNMLGVLVGADTGAAKIVEDYVNSKANYDITISNIKTFGKMICKSDTTVGGIVGKYILMIVIINLKIMALSLLKIVKIMFQSQLKMKVQTKLVE